MIKVLTQNQPKCIQKVFDMLLARGIGNEIVRLRHDAFLPLFAGFHSKPFAEPAGKLRHVLGGVFDVLFQAADERAADDDTVHERR